MHELHKQLLLQYLETHGRLTIGEMQGLLALQGVELSDEQIIQLAQEIQRETGACKRVPAAS